MDATLRMARALPSRRRPPKVLRTIFGVWALGGVAALGACTSAVEANPVAVPVTDLVTEPVDSAAPRTCETLRDVPPADVSAPPPDAEFTETGLAFRVLCPPDDEGSAVASGRVTVRYSGWSTDGALIDTSLGRGDVAFSLGALIPGLAEGLREMRAGEMRRFWIPEDLAYGGQAHGPQGMLVFDVRLVSLSPTNAPPPVPIDVAAPPPDASQTASGLASRVLRAGTGTAHPTATDQVRVHYTGWTTDGQMFDSSVVRGEPSTFPLNRLIMGWTEGIQLMVEGEKRRFWIPPRLAYDGRPGPQGTLVFDVELLEIL